MKTLDCRAQKCPLPVVEVRKVLRAEPEAELTVLVGDAIARENVGRLAASHGFAVAAAPTKGGFALHLTPGGVATSPAAGGTGGPTVVWITAEVMGSGDDQLGRLLLKNFLITLLDLDRAPDTILFVNAGVRLTCAGSELLGALEELVRRGSDVASCGLCLEFFGLKEQLAVGRPTNMLDIADSLARAGRVIRP